MHSKCAKIIVNSFLHPKFKLLQSVALLFIFIININFSYGQASASWNYAAQTGSLGTTYSWIDCSSGTSIVSGDDAQASISWPFNFSFYDNSYTTANSLSVCTNGFIRLDGSANTSYSAAQSYTLSSSSTELGQIIGTSVYDCKVGGIGSSWVKYLVTGSAPNRILTIEYNAIEIAYNDLKYANVQVSFYETQNKVVLKFGTDNVTAVGADMGIHSGVSGFYNKWQEVASGTNNSWVEYIPSTAPSTGPAASWNYGTQTGVLGTTYSWIDCSSGASVVSGDDAQAQISWPFNFSFYDNSYTTSNQLSIATNGFIRLDGVATTDYNTASTYDLTSTATNLGQIIAMSVYDDNVSGTGWVKSLVTGAEPNRIFTIEYNDLEIDYNDNKFADVQVSFYESTNKIVLKLGVQNINKSGVDMGIHSGVNTFFNKWQEAMAGTNNTWIEYAPPNVEVNATTGTSLAYYSTLKAAFDKINDGTHQGNITIKIKSNTTETASAALNASGAGSANYASVKIYPTKAGISVSGNIASPLIDLNGADNVIIDGRMNATGSTKDLIIDNTSTNAISSTSTIRFINDATNNTVKYCTIKGSEIAAGSGVITFSTTAGSTGNDANIIDNNNITSSADANRPVNAIYSLGTSGKDNSGNTISNNNIYNFLRPASNSSGIYLLANNSTWTINGNSFYETTSFASTGTFTYYSIYINNTSGNGFNVLNNYIGGTAAQCGGTAFTKTNARSNPFNAIYLNVGTTTTSSVQNNTIQNFNWSNSTRDDWTAINIEAGAVNIGTTTGNIIGSATGTGSVNVTAATNGQNVYGINIAGSGTVTCSNNIIASFIVANTNSGYASNFTGINTTSTGTNIISNNTIGNVSQANSINASSASTANIQSVYGIRNTAAGNITIDNNTIANLNNATSNTNTSTSGLVSGIASSSGINSITNNKISNLSIANANTASSVSASVTGIAVASTNTLNTISGNTIYNLSNSYNSFTGSVIGLYFGSSGPSNTVTANFIYSLSITGSLATSASIYGIKINTGQTTYANNIISLGGNTALTIYGIYESGTATNNNSIYFNTVYIFGSLGSEITNKSYALFSNASSNVRDFRNNIFMNARSTTAGNYLHYAAYFNYSTSTNLTVNYNDYFASGTGGVLGYYGGANKTTLPIVTGQDANSLNTNPVFATPGGANSSDYITATVLPGVFGTGITIDYDGISRNNPPQMGALESALIFVWQGNTSDDFGTASNWQNGAVPPNGADISFAATPANNCKLDANRALKTITNAQSARKLVVNGKQLTITGDLTFSNGAQIDATAASSILIFSGAAAQNIPSGAFVSNTIDALTLNNSFGLTQNGNVTLTAAFTLTSGAYNIGANTLTINGAVSTTSGTLSGGGSSNIVIGGSGANTILPAVALNNLTINRANGISLGGAVSVAGTLALTSGTLTLGAYTLAISGNSPTRTSGNINASNASATVVFSNSSAITLAASLFTGNINNLTINGAGITSGSDLTVNGVLNLQSANPSATKGSLDMGTYTLNLGSASTTTGVGDVTGIVRREHTFVQNVSYTFGSQYTTFTFSDGNTKPTWISLKISIGTVAPWTPWDPSPNGKVKRLYMVACSENSSTSAASINMRYLVSELDATYNDESKLVFWHKLTSYEDGTPHEHGKSNQDFTNHFIGVTGLILGSATTANLDDSQVTIAYPINAKNTWKGEVAGHETEWEQAQNWTYGHVPLSTEDVLIPDGLIYYPSLTASSNAVAKTIETHSGASISANAYDITVSGSGGAWINNGTFNAGTGKVLFIHGVPSEIVTVAGITNFYNIEVGANTTIQPLSGTILRIAGAGTANPTSFVDFSAINNTVEWNGADQTIVNPIGIAGNSGYFKLILSGSGTKTMPATAMNIADELILEGPLTATAQSSLTIGNELEILGGATFSTGAFNHTVGGHFDVGGHSNAGTFIPTAGYAITLNGSSVQNIYGGSAINFENLIINNSAGVDIFTDIVVNGALTLTSGNLNVGSTVLTINGAVSKTSGFINTTTQSSLAFGGTTALSLAGNLFYTQPSINNLTINRTGGVELGSNFTVNGIVNLQSANPSAIKGTLDMGTYTMLMGPTAINTGIGDMTGIVRRTTILANTEYTFGNPYSSVTFPAIGTLPTEISMKISIGVAPTWKTDGVQRVYDISQIGGSGTRGVIKAHYLDTELNGNAEVNISFFSYVIPSTSLLDRGRTEINTTENWLTLNNTDFGNLPSVFGVIEHGFGVSSSNVITWDGSESTDWFNQYNWIPAYSPDATKVVIIPDAASTPRDPFITNNSSSSVKTLTIQAGGVLNAGTGSQLTVVGTSGAWSNSGTFNASTGKVIFNSGILTEIVTITGITDFYNIEVGANTLLQPVSGSILRIAGTGVASATSKIDFSTVNNTVEWNGVNQTIVNPTGIGGNSGYYNLILSGSGTKTMPGTAMYVVGNFTLAGTSLATAAANLLITGNFTIANGAVFATGAFNHTLAGNFENNGTFTGTTGGKIILNGTTSQTISGTSTTSFSSLTIDNILGVAQASSINVNNVLTFINGTLSVGANTLGINGTVSNLSGNIDADSTSSLSFGGTSAITLNNNLFNGAPVITNLTINRSGGVTLGNESITVIGALDLQSGTLTLAANSLTIAGNTVTRSTGNINASNTSATLAFTNSAAITLPASVITGNINNLIVNGAGINASGDISINGVLSLLSANQSATIGSLNMSTYTLNMGASASTNGIGDVTGIVKRQHTFLNGVEYSFGNQYTSLNFLGVQGGIKPTWVSCKIEIGTAPSWREEAINRIYSFAQTGGTDRMIVKLHYLDSELHGTETDETKLVYWDAYDPDLTAPYVYTTYPRNHNATDAANNWIQLTGPAINYLATSSTLDVKQWGLSYTDVVVHTWIGLGSVSYPGDWSLPGHWDGGVPQADNEVLIPTNLPSGNSGYPYRNLLSDIAPSTAKSITIEAGAFLGVTDFDITVSGYGDAWVNNGTFNPGTGNVIFNHGNEEKVVNLLGTTNFYNLTAGDKTHIKASTGCITRIAGSFNAQGGSILNFTDNTNTVEYNGSGAQTILNPTNNIASGYHNLIVSGGGIKTLPASTLNIRGDFTTNASISATDNTLVLNGTIAQSISGSVAPELYNFTISNVDATVTAGVNINCSGDFTNSSEFDMSTYALAVSSTVANTGTVKTASVSTTPLPSGKSWGGTVLYYKAMGGQTVIGGTFNDLTLSNTSGTQSASGNLTVNGTLTTTSGGLLNMVANQLLGTLNTITNGGTIRTQNTSATPIPIGKTWGGTVQYNSLTGGQTTMAGTYNTLTLSNSSGTQTANGDITATTFNTASGGTMDMGTNALVVTNLSHSGILRTQNISSSPFTSGKIWGGTVVFDGSASQTLPTPSSTFNNLSISNTAGITAAANQTVNGILNLSAANPDAAHGSLDMATYTLNLGANATTIGDGDVTGIITRTSFTTNTIYTYGNPNQYLFFPNTPGQTLPSEVTVRISLLSTPPDWVADGALRLYEISQTGGIGTKALFRANYLDSELPGGIDESLLSIWSRAYQDNDYITDEGWSDYNSTENWITIADVDFQYLPAGLGNFEVALAPTSKVFRTWNGSQNTSDWNTASNWTPNGVPIYTLGIVIPHVDSSNNYSPDIPVGATGKYIIIQNGGIVNTLTGAGLTLSGNGNVWSIENGGLFNAGNSNVTFAGGISAGIVGVSGYSDFYDLTISDTTTLRPGVNSYIGIAGTLTNNGVLEAAATHNTIEFKEDASLTIPNPNGSTPGYHTLIISGAGTKTLPASLNIWHDFINNGTVDAGTGSVTFDGLHSGQIIGGSSNTEFYGLTIANNTWEITTEANITVGGTLTINDNATLNPGSAYTIDGAGTLTGSGTAIVTGLTAINSFCTQYPIATTDLSNLTVDYKGAGNQTVCAEDYGNLRISPNGTRTVTLASSGTIGVSGVFDPDLTNTGYSITGSTMECNGTGSQTVPKFNYYNVIVSGNRSGGTITLVNGGTIGIAGHSTVSATGCSYELTNNTIDINGSGGQSIDPFTFYNVIFSGGGTKTTSGDLTVVGSFTVQPGVTLNMDASVLSSPYGGSVTNSGTIQTACPTSTSTIPLPTGKTWGGTIEYTGSSAQTLVAGTYNNLIMSGAGGGTAAADITVNGVLNLSHANPSPTQGILHTGNSILSMGGTATTIGAGDVTGIVKRQHTFANGVEYSFGNQFTTINFLGVAGATKPTWISCKIEIGAAPVWRTENVKRIYSFLQADGTDRTYVKLHYLDSELNASEPDENKLIMYTDKDGLITGNNTVALGKTTNNDEENWVELLGMAINQIATSSTTYAKEYGLGYTNVSIITWTGNGAVLYPGDWSLPGNWLGGVPTASDDVLIPGGLTTAYPYRNLLSAYTPSVVKTIEIEAGATVALNGYDITISGDANAWANNGTLNAGTNAIIFNNGSTSNAAEIAGATNFYNLIVGDNTKIQPATGSISRIAGTITAGSGSILDFSANANTVEYNSNTAQTVINPGSGYGYYHLTFSGNGNKTLPTTSLSIFGDLTFNSPVLTTGNTLFMEGSGAQNIYGTTPISLNSLTIDNLMGVTLNANALASIKGTLLINNGMKFEMAAGQELTVTGSIINNSGNDGLVLKSDATGTASLIHNTNNIPATVERYISGGAEDWHFLSSPVANQEISDDWLPSGTYGNGTGYDLYLWNEPTSCWIYKLNTTSPVNWNTVHPGADFAAGRGYLYSVQDANPTKSFLGNLNNGDQAIPIKYNGVVDSVKGFNLVGNPYASSIDWSAASGWEQSDLVESGGGYNMWIWNPAANNYGVYNSVDADGIGTNSITRYIAPMQGFFVEAANTGNLGMSNAIRVHNGAGDWFKNQQIQTNNLNLIVSSEAGFGSDEILLEFGFDEKKNGAKKIFSHVKTAPSLYMNSKGEGLSVGYFTTPDETLLVPVNFTPGHNGYFTLDCQFEKDSFVMAWLEDKKESYYVNLKELPEYHFSAEASDAADRFVLHFGTMSPQENKELPARIYFDGNNMVVDLSLVDQDATLQLVDLLGRVLYKQEIQGKMKNEIQVLMEAQIILVYVSTPEAFICRKIYINKH